MKNIIVFLVYFAWMLPVALGATIHVPGDQPTIQDGIDAAVSGDTVMVAAGTYSGPGNRDIDFSGKDIFVRSDTTWQHCVIDCEGTSADNHRGFYFHSGETRDSVVMGFTIQNGYMSDSGAGIYCGQNSSPFISDCCIQNNTADTGAGLWSGTGSAPRFAICLFQNNHAETSGGAGTISQSDALFEKCTFHGNTAVFSGGMIIGGYASPFFTFCEFVGNVSETNGGAMYLGYQSSPSVKNCTFSGNLAWHLGGAIFIDYTATPIIGGSMGAGNVFSGNSAGSGADLCCYYFDPTEPVNVTWNRFSGHCQSDFYVCPLEAFDLSDCVSQTTPIVQDVYVTPSGDDQNDGLTWNTAFKTLGHALEMVSGSASNPLTIFLGPGVYSPSTNGESYSLPIVDYVTIAGSGSSSTVLNAEGLSRLLYAHLDDHAQIRDLTIKGGDSIEGGALYLVNSATTFDSCKITENNSHDIGGAAYLQYASPVFNHCQITGNSAMGAGGGIYNTGEECGPTFLHCDISFNVAKMGSGGGYYNHMFGLHRFHDCTIMYNAAQGAGGGLSLGYKLVWAEITGCVISENSADDMGGGIFSGWNVSATIANSIITHNTASTFGGGIFLSDQAPTDIFNCTISSNGALSDGGGIYCMQQSHLQIENSILWDDTPNELSGELALAAVTYSDIQGGYAGPGNINESPLFIFGPNGSCYLSQTASGQPSDSPCVNAGGDAADNIFYGTAEDDIRMSETTTRTDGVVDIDQVDMGYHYKPVVPTVTPTQTPSPTATPVQPTGTPSHTPTDTPTDVPTATPENTPSPTSSPMETPVPPSPTAPCTTLGAKIWMPALYYQPGNPCACTVFLCNPESVTYNTVPLFVLLEVAGSYFFAPSFEDFDYYTIQNLAPGVTPVEIIHEFIWPEGTGSASEINWYAAMTNESQTELFGAMDTWTFGWGE